MSGEKSEKATPKRLKDLRKKGSAARSMELPAGVSMVAMVLVLPSTLHRLAEAGHTDMALALGSAGTTDLAHAMALASMIAGDSVRAFAPLVAIVGGSALAASVLVTRSK